MRALLLPVLASLLALPIVVADPYVQSGRCDSDGQPALHRIEITGGSADSTVYVDDENFATGNGIWIYAETNGLWVPKAEGVYFEGLSNANLQRGWPGGPLPDDHDICADAWDFASPDVLIF